jgi:hypothetical protein
MDAVDPSLAKARIDTHEPIWIKSSTLKDEARRVIPYVEIALPMRIVPLTLKPEPNIV